MLSRWFRLMLLLPLSAAVAGAMDGALVLDPAQSHLEIAVHATMDSFTAKLAAFDPVIAVDEQGNITRAHFAFHFRDVLTGKAKRDAAMHEWQQTDAFPDGVFDLTSIRRTDDHTLAAVGRLTLHGVSREVSFPVSVTRDGSVLVIDGAAKLDTREFALPVIRLMGLLKVDPQVQVRFHVQGSRADVALTRS